MTLGNRALLSPNDWKETNQFQDEFVLTLYQVFGVLVQSFSSIRNLVELKKIIGS
ncbi:hypothetical protein B808_1051 [Fructilactobacillus florum 8D]|uniref:Uncharacterized protein n=1 Tax=Fructilactobacillus florum 8D TaxID=1221538 RepID=W9EGD2_9LACO|nr:hypothetical protein B808_1051 [Fructilactobacillus florum 8D]